MRACIPQAATSDGDDVSVTLQHCHIDYVMPTLRAVKRTHVTKRQHVRTVERLSHPFINHTHILDLVQVAACLAHLAPCALCVCSDLTTRNQPACACAHSTKQNGRLAVVGGASL
jgi:hypothetical protein